MHICRFIIGYYYHSFKCRYIDTVECRPAVDVLKARAFVFIEYGSWWSCIGVYGGQSQAIFPKQQVYFKCLHQLIPGVVTCFNLKWIRYAFTSTNATIIMMIAFKIIFLPMNVTRLIILMHRQTSNISRTIACNEIIDHSDVVGASPDGVVPTTFNLTTGFNGLDKGDCKTRRETLKFWDLVTTYIRDFTVNILRGHMRDRRDLNARVLILNPMNVPYISLQHCCLAYLYASLFQPPSWPPSSGFMGHK